MGRLLRFTDENIFILDRYFYLLAILFLDIIESKPVPYIDEGYNKRSLKRYAIFL